MKKTDKYETHFEKYFKAKPIRMSEDVWEKFKQARKDRGLGWNKFIQLLLELLNKQK